MYIDFYILMCYHYNVNIYYGGVMSYRVEVFSKNDGTLKISKNFQVKEFACKDGSDIILINTELVDILQIIRDFFGSPVIINSAYRTPAHNKKVGGVDDSVHLYGSAADITVRGVKSNDVYDFVNKLFPDKYGLGLYPTFVHIDVRPIKSRWIE